MSDSWPAFKDTRTVRDIDLAWHGKIADREPQGYATIGIGPSSLPASSRSISQKARKSSTSALGHWPTPS